MRVFVYYDVSGSIPTKLLNEMFFEAEWRRSCMEYDEWKEFTFDSRVLTFDEYLDGPYQGGGGTDSMAVYKHWCENSNSDDAFLLLTDGCMAPMPLIPGGGPAAFVIVGEFTFGTTSPLRPGCESEDLAGISDE